MIRKSKGVKTHLCPVCRKYSFSQRNSQAKCPVCGWIDDEYQTEHIFVGSGVNSFSLAQQRKAWNMLQGEEEVGYGIDNLHWGAVEACELNGKKLCMDECMYKLRLVMEGKLPVGITNLTQAREKCTHCIISRHANLEGFRDMPKMLEQDSGRDTYGCGGWGCGIDEYEVATYQKHLRGLIKYCHEEKEKQQAQAERTYPSYEEAKAYLENMAQEDEQRARNFNSYFYRPLLSIADFIEYCTDEQGNLDHRCDLWAYGSYDAEEPYEFTPEVKHKAEQVLHLSLSFANYKCFQYIEEGLYYMDNAYRGWDINEFKDTIAVWFVDIGDEINEQFIKDYIEETLRESFAYSHVKLALLLMSHLGFAKADPKLQQLVKLYGRVPALRALTDLCKK